MPYVNTDNLASRHWLSRQFKWAVTDYKDLSLVWKVDRNIRPEDHCLANCDREGWISLSTPHT